METLNDSRPAIVVTDFGQDSAKGRLLAELHRIHFEIHRRAPEILDEVHTVPLGCITAGSWELSELAQGFDYRKPVVVGVVDPGVADGARKAIALETQNGISYVGPDNGLPTRLVELFGVKHAVELDPEHRRVPKEKTSTFDGRDFFAVQAGKLLVGEEIHNLGNPLDTAVVRLEHEPGTVQYTDTVSGIAKFLSGQVGGLDLHQRLQEGNTASLRAEVTIDRSNRTEWTRPQRNGTTSNHPVTFKPFSQVGVGSNAIYAGSSGVPELCVYLRRACEELDVGVGDRITVHAA